MSELGWSWGTPPLRTLSAAQGLQTAASCSQQGVIISLGRDGDSEGCLNHPGFPWARQDLGTLPCRMSGQGGWMGKELLPSQTCSPGAISLLTDLTRVGWPQVRNRIKVAQGICESRSYDHFLCIRFQGLFSVHRVFKLRQLPCKVCNNVKTEISSKWLLQTTLASWHFRLFSTHP